MVCETCWSIASTRAYGRGGCAADYYSNVLKEREGVCEEGLLARTTPITEPELEINNGLAGQWGSLVDGSDNGS